tara:strand:- start:61 stop:654 length:594 start_codon:yes stop_codon:yes gene_type:complete
MVLLIQCQNEASAFDWMAFAKDIAPIVIGFAALFFSWYQLKSSETQKKNENRRNEIYKKLNDFYGPYIQLRKKSHILYQKFQKKYRAKDVNFSTLRYLLKGQSFDENENALLKAIIDIGTKCEDLIQKNAGLIDDDDLRNNLIPKASTHYLLLRLAYEGNLKGDIENFLDSSFPKEIDAKLEDRKIQLENELNKLNS